MSRFKGKVIEAEIFGGSREKGVGVKIKGLSGFSFDEKELEKFLCRRKPSDKFFSTERKESDKPVFSDGLSDGKISGELVCEIFNEDAKNTEKLRFIGIPRPSHADYVRYLTFGETDFSGGGEFSGRMTAPYSVLGGICKQILEKNFGTEIRAYLVRVGNAAGKDYYNSDINEIFNGKEYVFCDKNGFPSLSDADEMLEEIKKAKLSGDSVGAEIECVVKNAPAGLGGSLFGGLEGKIAYLAYAIPAVKSVEFGLGGKLSESSGSEANDGMTFDENGKVVFLSNNSGGIDGGISNGNDIVFRAALKPAPTISKPQKTVDLINRQNVETSFCGRNDVCVGVRAVPVIESAAAIAVLDEILSEQTK